MGCATSGIEPPNNTASEAKVEEIEEPARRNSNNSASKNIESNNKNVLESLSKSSSTNSLKEKSVSNFQLEQSEKNTCPEEVLCSQEIKESSDRGSEENITKLAKAHEIDGSQKENQEITKNVKQVESFNPEEIDSGANIDSNTVSKVVLEEENTDQADDISIMNEDQEKFNHAIRLACELTKPEVLESVVNANIHYLQLVRSLPHTVKLSTLLSKLTNLQVSRCSTQDCIVLMLNIHVR